MPQQGAGPEADQERDPDHELEPQPDLDHLVDRRVLLRELIGGVAAVDRGGVPFDEGGRHSRDGAWTGLGPWTALEDCRLLLRMLHEPCLQLRLVKAVTAVSAVSVPHPHDAVAQPADDAHDEDEEADAEVMTPAACGDDRGTEGVRGHYVAEGRRPARQAIRPPS